ncbi:MAG: TonB-dependent receptor plug domain-containing protein [Gammaproteobacteria bacterium]
MKAVFGRLALGFFALMASGAQAQDVVNLRDYLTLSIEQGVRVIYSEDVVARDYTIQLNAQRDDPIVVLRRELGALGLALRAGPAQTWLVVRGSKITRAPAPSTEVADTTPPPVEQIIVSASRHRLANESLAERRTLDRDTLDTLPLLGREPLRAITMLPGTAGGGISARSHVRGGDLNEQLVMLDGLRLYEPFHLKDFGAPASVINAAAIEHIDYYAGGFGAQFGDRMSSVVDISLADPAQQPPWQIEMSTLNASITSLGQWSTGEWLISARRSNLDLSLDALDINYGKPRFSEVLAHAAQQIGTRHRFALNALISRDRITLNDLPDESAQAAYNNRYVWLRIDTAWSEKLTSRTVISHTDIDNERQGALNAVGEAMGSVDDRRAFRIGALEQLWQWQPRTHWSATTGFSARRLNALYRYDSSLALTPQFEQLAPVNDATARNLTANPAGTQYAVHAAVRMQRGKWIADMGLRWDAQTYTTAADDDQVSPRINLLYRHDARTDLRLSFGRYYQAQEVNELQIDAGVTEFAAAQRSEHAIITLTHRLPSEHEIRLEAYRKTVRSIQPRFENLFDSLVLLPDLRADRIQINASSARTRGVEVSINSPTDLSLQWWLSYTWSQAYDNTASGRVARSWDQPHALKAGASGRFGAWSAGMSLDVHSGWPRTSAQLDANGISANARNAERHPTFARLDLRIGRSFAVAHGDLEGFLEIENALNRDNACCLRLRVEDGTLVSDRANWLPLFATVGARWQF